jgi:two-component system chemotaxis response regulator CheB
LIRVLLAEDVLSVRGLLRELLTPDPMLRIVAEVRRADAAWALERYAADLVLFGVPSRASEHIDRLRQVAAKRPLPILAVAHPGSGPAAAYGALEAGAVEVFWLHPLVSEERSRQLVGTVHRLIPPRACGAGTACAPRQTRVRPRAVVVGSSAGGPAALRAFLQSLPNPMPLPVVIAQHIDHGFLEALLAWMSQVKGCEKASTGIRPEPNRVYFAPEQHDLAFSQDGSLRVLAPGSGHFHPCADRLFESAAQTFGAGAVGVVLSGMGCDGARGCAAIGRADGRVLVQSPSSAAAPGMPEAALQTGAAEFVEVPERLGAYLAQFARPALRVVG